MYLWLTVLLVTLMYLYYRNRRVRSQCNFLSGPEGYPFIGNGLELTAGGPEDFFATTVSYVSTYGDRCRVFLGEQLVILFTDPKDAEVILCKKEFINRSNEYNFMKPWVGTGLLTSDGLGKWKKQRKVITPAFHFKILENFIEVFDKQGNIFIEKLRSHAGKGAFDIYKYVTLCALDIICETAMGISVNAQNDSDSLYVKAVKDLCETIINRFRNPLKRSDILFPLSSDYRLQKKALKFVHGYTDTVIKQRKNILNSSNETFSSYTEEADVYGSKRKMAFLDLLLLSTVDGKSMPDVDIRDEVDSFLFGGHDTTSSAIGFLIYELSRNIDIQDKIFNEQKEIFSGDLSRSTTHSDLLQMKYLDLVIKETLRLYPSVPMMSRKASAKTNINGLEVPKEASVLVFSYVMHRNPEIFPDPEKFIPERFLPEESSKRNPFSYLPFGAGPRNCIGQKYALLEMKSSISKLVRNYVIEPSFPRPLLSAGIILKSVNGINIKIKSREIINSPIV